MKTLTAAAAILLLLPTSLCALESNLTEPLSSSIILPATFKPPQVFRNTNLLRSINLEKGYPRETINVVIENTNSQPQDEYFLPFDSTTLEKVGGIEVRDKKQENLGPLDVKLVDFDSYSPIQFYRIKLSEPLKSKGQQTLAISYFLLESLVPLPATINQMDKQFLVYTFSAYAPSAYITQKQKTKLKFPGTDIPEYTTRPAGNLDGKNDPQTQGSTFTYGPYGELPAGAQESVSVRYEFTKPVLHASLLERDIEVSHWGGNLATEERYWLGNNGANLKTQFSRASWATSQYYNPATSALKELKMPLRVGSTDPYFTDDIGNVSTSRFRSNRREANLELKPRYPIFGGWKYSFRVGWDANLKGFLRKLSGSDTYVLKVPFLEGPKQPEGIEYKKVNLRVILPEGAKNIRYQTSVPLVAVDRSIHRTFMDTQGRTMLQLTAVNVADEMRDRDLIVTYEYPLFAGLRKPITIFSGVASVLVAVYALLQVNIGIGKGS